MTPMEKLVAAERARERVGKVISGLSKLKNQAFGDTRVVEELVLCENYLAKIAAARRKNVLFAERELWGD